MPLTNTQAALLSRDEVLKGLVENDPKRIGLAPFFPFFPIWGGSLTVPRVTNANLGTAIWDVGGSAVSDTSAVPTNPNVGFELKLLISSFKVNYTAEEIFSSVSDQIAFQVQAAIQRMYYKFWTTFNTGNASANPEEFDGLRRLVTSGQTLTARGGIGGVPSLSELDELISKVRTNGGQPTVLYTSPQGREAIRRAHYRAQVTPEMIDLPHPRNAGATYRCLAFAGVPVVVDDNVPDNETSNNYTSIYALVLGKEGIYGVIPRGYEGRMIQVSKSLVDGVAQETDVVYWPVGVALDAETGVARLQQVGS